MRTNLLNPSFRSFMFDTAELTLLAFAFSLHVVKLTLNAFFSLVLWAPQNSQYPGNSVLPQLPGPGGVAGLGGVAASLNYGGGGGGYGGGSHGLGGIMIGGGGFGNSPPSMQISQAPRMNRRYDHLPSI